MYVACDKSRHAIIYRLAKLETLRALVNIELPHVPVHIFEETSFAAYAVYSVETLRDIFSGLTGGLDPHSYNREYLTGQIMRLCQSAQPTDVEDFEVIVQSLQVPPTDRGFYQYVKNTNRAKPLKEGHEPFNLLGDWAVAQALPIPTRGQSPVDPVQAAPEPVALCPAAQTTPPKYAPPWA